MKYSTVVKNEELLSNLNLKCATYVRKGSKSLNFCKRLLW